MALAIEGLALIWVGLFLWYFIFGVPPEKPEFKPSKTRREY